MHLAVEALEEESRSRKLRTFWRCLQGVFSAGLTLFLTSSKPGTLTLSKDQEALLVTKILKLSTRGCGINLYNVRQFTFSFVPTGTLKQSAPVNKNIDMILLA
jgi:hypothetical protein